MRGLIDVWSRCETCLDSMVEKSETADMMECEEGGREEVQCKAANAAVRDRVGPVCEWSVWEEDRGRAGEAGGGGGEMQGGRGLGGGC